MGHGHWKMGGEGYVMLVCVLVPLLSVFHKQEASIKPTRSPTCHKLDSDAAPADINCMDGCFC